MHVCNTHKNVRSARAVSVLQKYVRATGVCVCTPPVAHTLVATTWVRTLVGTILTAKKSKHHHSITIFERIPSDLFSIFLTRFWSTSLLSTNHQMYELILLGFPRHARRLILDDAFVWKFWIWVPVHREVVFPIVWERLCYTFSFLDSVHLPVFFFFFKLACAMSCLNFVWSNSQLLASWIFFAAFSLRLLSLWFFCMYFFVTPRSTICDSLM